MCQPDDLDEIALLDERPGRRTHFLARLSPQVKLLVLCVGLLANLVSSSAVSSSLLAIGCLTALVAVGIDPRTLAKRLAIPWYLAGVAFVTQVVLVGSTPLFQLGPFTAYAEGVAQGALLCSRIVGGTSLVLAFSLTSTVTDLLSLAAWLKLPPVLVEIGCLTYRYLFLLAEEGQKIREAQTARLGHSTWSRSVQSYAVLTGMVLVRSYDRAEAVYQAMAARGYRGTMPTHACKRLDLEDLRFGSVALVVLLTMFWLGDTYGL